MWKIYKHTFPNGKIYIGYGIEPAPEIKEKIDKRHKQNLFKLMPMAQYKMEE